MEQEQRIDRIIQAVEECVLCSHTFTPCKCKELIAAELDAERADEREECACIVESYVSSCGSRDPLWLPTKYREIAARLRRRGKGKTNGK